MSVGDAVLLVGWMVLFQRLLMDRHGLAHCYVASWLAHCRHCLCICTQGHEYGIRVSSRMDRFSDMYTLRISSADKFQDR